MSTQNIATLDNLPTGEALGQYLTQKSIDVLKYLRFEIGCINYDEISEILRLQRLVCSKFCYIDSEQDRFVREAVIRKSINKIFEL